ncbi:hypothetical protein [Thauera sinica]|nr:hypothetical protein [Thauera sp. K11]
MIDAAAALQRCGAEGVAAASRFWAALETRSSWRPDRRVVVGTGPCKRRTGMACFRTATFPKRRAGEPFDAGIV